MQMIWRASPALGKSFPSLGGKRSPEAVGLHLRKLESGMPARHRPNQLQEALLSSRVSRSGDSLFQASLLDLPWLHCVCGPSLSCTKIYIQVSVVAESLLAHRSAASSPGGQVSSSLPRRGCSWSRTGHCLPSECHPWKLEFPAHQSS